MVKLSPHIHLWQPSSRTIKALGNMWTGYSGEGRLVCGFAATLTSLDVPFERRLSP
jgi:hypothetical protein